jgi:O-antigen/teichoic acid export membrane protein
LGSTIPQAVRFLLIPVYTVFLNPADYGILEITGSLSAFLVILMRFGVPGAVTRFYFDHSEGPSLRDYVTTIAIFLLASSLLVAAATIAIGPWLFTWIAPGVPFYPLGLIVVGAAFIGCNQNLQDRLVQAREQASYAAILNISRATVALGLAVFLVAGLKWGVFGMLLAELIAGTLFSIQAMRYLWPDLKGRFRFDLLRSSFVYAAGILPSHFMGSVAPLFTRSYLANMGSLAALGQLGIASRFTLPLTTLGASFQTALNPIYYSVRKEGGDASLQKLARTASTAWTIGITCVLAGILFIPPLIKLMTPARFHIAADLVPILCIGFVGQTLYTFTCPEIFYSKRTYWIPLISGLTAFVTILVTVTTTREFGAQGVAAAMAAGSITAGITSAILSARMVRIPYPLMSMAGVGLCALAFAIGGQLISLDAPVLQLIAATLALLLFGLCIWFGRRLTFRD